MIIGSRRPSLFDGYTVAALAVLLLVDSLAAVVESRFAVVLVVHVCEHGLF